MTTNIPQIDPTYECPDPAFWERIDTLSKKGKITNILISGKTGTGKTTWAEQLAAHYNRPFFALECGTIVEAEQMIGFWEVVPNASGDGAHTRFVTAGFMDAAQTNRAVLLLNEINRYPSIKATNATFSLLDHQRKLYIPELQTTIKVADGITFVGTINEGAAYTGTDVLDLAFRSRFSRYVQLDWLPEEQEQKVLITRTGVDPKTAEELINLATNLRSEHPVSLRQLEACAEEYLLGASLETAILTTLSGVVPMDKLAMMASQSIKSLTSRRAA